MPCQTAPVLYGDQQTGARGGPPNYKAPTHHRPAARAASDVPISPAPSSELPVPADVLSQVFAAIRAEAAERGKSLGRLTQRGLEILRSFSRGMSYARIAEEREVLPVTVRNAVYGIQRKLDD